MRSFFGLPSNIEERVNSFNNIWKNQVLLSKISNISIDLSDTFTQQQIKQTFNSLKEIAKAQEDSYKEAINS